jgi:hypothetical protein
MSTITSLALSRRTFEEVENWYRQALITQDQWEAYTYVWATTQTRFSDTLGLETPPTDAAVIAIVEEIQAELTEGQA